MLKLRVITAIVLLAVLLPLLFHDNATPFVAFALLILSAGVWEWGRLNGLRTGVAMIFGGIFGGSLAVMWWRIGFDIPKIFWVLAVVLWGFVAPWLLLRGVSGWGCISQIVRLAAGLLALALAWIAMAQARTVGINFLLSIFAVVWVADIAAYFGGKAFGRRKLASSISPGKSWEGAVAGWLGVMVLAFGWTNLDSQMTLDSPSIFSLLQARSPWLCWFVFSGLSALSVVGDLVESLVKRSAGFKDSSRLLPGHGGVLDRIDALLPVLPVAMLFVNF